MFFSEYSINQLSVLGMEAMAREKFDDKHHLMIYF